MAEERPFRQRPWKQLERHDVLVVPGRFSVTRETVELPDGRIRDDWWQISETSYVVVFAETVDHRIVCLRQYRHGSRRVGLELIAGHMEPGENPLDAARRELLEESGYASASWVPLGSYVIAEQSASTAHFFKARDAVQWGLPSSGDLEEATLELLTRHELVAELRAGLVSSVDLIAAMSLAMLVHR